MADKGVLFKPEMVRALLNTKVGSWPAEPIDPSKPYKWQTRRIAEKAAGAQDVWAGEKDGLWSVQRFGDPCHALIKAPHSVGDILYVRETWMENDPPSGYIYRATDEASLPYRTEGWKWRPSLFMPKVASRIYLEVMEVRCERVNAISEADAKAEGIWGFIHPECEVFYFGDRPNHGGGFDKASQAFGCLWDSINKKQPFDTGLWVFAYSLKRIK
jgi:hypothetical protein